jgi:hypothetical protein
MNRLLLWPVVLFSGIVLSQQLVQDIMIELQDPRCARLGQLVAKIQAEATSQPVPQAPRSDVPASPVPPSIPNVPAPPDKPKP